MDFRRLLTVSFAWFLTIQSGIKQPQVHGCSFEGITDAGCLNQGENSIPDSCCRALNQAVEAGFGCLCLFVSSFNPQFSTQLLLSLSSCFITVPSLSQCPATLAKLHPPASPVPLLHPPASPVSLLISPSAGPSPLLHPPDTPVPLLPPENLFPPTAQEEVDQVPMNSTPYNNSIMDANQPCLSDTVHEPCVIVVDNGDREDKFEILLNPLLLLAITLYALLA